MSPSWLCQGARPGPLPRRAAPGGIRIVVRGTGPVKRTASKISNAIAQVVGSRRNAIVPSALAAFEQARRERLGRVVAHGAGMSSNKTPRPIGRVIRDLALPLIHRRSSEGVP
jgi:hypothetical protein